MKRITIGNKIYPKNKILLLNQVKEILQFDSTKFLDLTLFKKLLLQD